LCTALTDAKKKLKLAEPRSAGEKSLKNVGVVRSLKRKTFFGLTPAAARIPSA